MKILVIGGTRYFGKRLVHLFVNDGAQVSVLNRGQTPEDFGNAVTKIRVDRGDEAALHDAVANMSFDVVIDQICFTPQEALSACKIFEKKTKRYVVTSTMSVYGGLTGELREADFNAESEAYDESQFKAKYDYAEGKRLTEAVFAQCAAFPVSMARFPIVLGADDYTGRLEFHIDRVRAGKEIYFPAIESKISFINSNDAARFLHFLAHSTFEGSINGASSDAIVLKSLMEFIEKRVGKKATYAPKASVESHSPFGVPKDYTLNVHRSQGLGFSAVPISKWMPDLIASLTSR